MNSKNITGEAETFESLIFGIFDLVDVLVACPKSKRTVQMALPELIYYLIIFSEITAKQVRNYIIHNLPYKYFFQ